jgi:uncharacterized protein (TIGR02391 family)
MLLALEPEDLGGVLLELWSENISLNDQCRFETFYNPLWNQDGRHHYPTRSEREVELAIAEALGWLKREGLILTDPRSPDGGGLIRSRRGKKVKLRADIEAYKQASLLPRALLHPLVSERAYPLFIRGDYDIAVLQAFKSVEVTVREAAGQPDEQVGVTLMRKAFHVDTGKLTDMSVIVAERQAVLDLFVGAIGHAKNPQSHRDKPLNIKDAAQLLQFASYLLSMVDLRRLLA